MVKKLVERIKSIPPLPDTYKKISAICSDPNGTILELTKVVEQDPMLVANILKLVNSPLYGLNKTIMTVSQAVSLLGMSEVYSLSAVVSVKKLLKIDMEPYGITPERFALISNMQGALIKRWIGVSDKEKSEILFMPALLQEIGKIIIADEIVKNDEVFQFRSDIQSAIDISEVEKMYMGVTSSEVTAKIFEHWGFDNFLVNIIGYSDVPNSAEEDYKIYSQYLHIVKTAVALNAPLSDRNITIAINYAKKEKLDSRRLSVAIDAVRDMYEDEI